LTARAGHVQSRPLFARSRRQIFLASRQVQLPQRTRSSGEVALGLSTSGKGQNSQRKHADTESASARLHGMIDSRAT
jgi:hypothetical protein